MTMVLTRLSPVSVPITFFPVGPLVLEWYQSPQRINLFIPFTTAGKLTSPRVHGLTTREPITLSMLSSRCGALRAGYVGAWVDTVGLNVALVGE